MNRKLLVVDDETDILDGYRAILSASTGNPRLVSSRRRLGSVTSVAQIQPVTESFEVSFASNGQEALAFIQEGIKKDEPFVGGFFDVKLGKGMDGIETIRLAKEIDPNLLVVLVTAYQDRGVDEINKIFGDEFSDHWDLLFKPFSHSEILQKARHLISDWNRRQREGAYVKQIQTQQTQLIRSERVAAVGTLARSVGHEFGNILLRIIGKADLALEKKDPKQMVEALEVIASSAERAGVIVRNLQALVQIQVKYQTGSLKAPIDEAVSLIRHELEKNSVELTVMISEGLPEIRLNRVEIGQVILNLIINAMHSMEPNGGKLTISSQVDAEEIRILIADTGSGIRKEHIEQIFEPLFTTKQGKGSGLGLSVSKKIMENHSGDILVTSSIGKGTTFTLVFPRDVIG